MSDVSDGKSLTYREAGVDIDEGNLAVRSLRPFVESTRTPRVVGGVGAFAGLFAYPRPDSDTLLVASMDGVGTKLRLSAHLGRWKDAGFDIVSHCVSDILVMGARPLFFLDYVGMGKLHASVVADLVEGMAEACRPCGCALLGGETAEMPGVYPDGEADVVGTILGEVSRSRLIDGRRIEVGDRLLGLSSIGLHTNGYSLARKILGSDERPSVFAERPDPAGATWGDLLTARHRLYFPLVEPLLATDAIRGMAHITGGGLTENIPRILPAGTRAAIDRSAWPVPPVFR
ncbi:MAG: phosphoribosylformylglycinamidine cyclo-ligase, partial [Candidatus Eisenbacteria bacterium]|nr:phosphoribosylformylglycinamidine cyclo-ligase [Candidatus Eisenbacteria bacterium]